MASIFAENVSLVFPLIGSDARFIRRAVTKNHKDTKQVVGGAIINDPSQKRGIRAVDNLTLNLKDGDRLGIYGHNGAGKTTLLRLLGGIYPPTSGKLRIEGRITGLFSLGLGINKELSGLENIKIKAMMYGLSRREIDSIISEIVEFSELGEYVHMPVKTYSSGMTLRLQFSIATALKPDILLMDEWISSADKQFKEKMDKRLDQMIDETSIVIIASHNEDRLYGWAKTVIHMERGRIVETKDTSEYMPVSDFKPDPEKVQKYNQLVNMGEKRKAFDMIDEVWPEAEDPIGHYSKVAVHWFRANEFERALEVYNKLFALQPENPKFYDQVGRLYFKMGNQDEAARHLLTALQISDGAVGNINVLKKVASEVQLQRLSQLLLDKS